MNLLEAVNRMFRLNAIIRGDTDEITSFSDIQHNASMNLAIIAVQDELSDLISDHVIDSERVTGSTITTSANTRTYALPAGFLRFYGTPHFRSSVDDRELFEYRGGLVQLQTDVLNWDSQTGEPTWWYWEPTTSKKVGFFQVPDQAYTFKYEYEGTTMVDTADDELPFHNDEESFAFCQMAARRFKFLFEDVKGEADIQAILEGDRSYLGAKRRLMNLMKPKAPAKSYGYSYV